MRRLFTTCLFCMTVIAIWAVKAYPFPVNITQSDGTVLTIIQHGDEYFHYVTTVDGILLYQDGNNYYVAHVNEQGELSSTGMLAHNADQRGADESILTKAQDRGMFMRMAASRQDMMRAKHEPVEATTLDFPHTGNPKAIAILVEFSDTTFSLGNPRASFDQYLNGEGEMIDYGNGELNNYETVREYMKTCSFGQYSPQFDVYGPITLSNPLKYYGGTNSKGSDEKMSYLFADACTMMDDSLDFSAYDANEDGYVDLVVIIYAGYSQAMSGNSNECIWPKSGNMGGGTYDGKKVSRYAVGPELNGFPNCYKQAPFKRINGIGVFCHELSHCLGLPDLYPTLDSSKGDNQAMEFWSLMDSGCYLINGNAPVAYTAWEREALGWMEIEDLENDADMSMQPVDDGGKAYRIRNDYDETGHEYYIIENIQNRGINIRQKGHGLLLMHVDYDASAFSLSGAIGNSVNNIAGKPRMTVVPADGLLFAQYNIDGITYKNNDFYNQLAGDPFPGTSNVTAINDTMEIVNFQVYNGYRLNKALDNISEDSDGTVSFRFVSDFNDYCGISNLSPTATIPDDRLFTISGVFAGTQTGMLPKGVYIKNGKKIIVR